MRPIIGVNGDCLWLCGDVCHPPSSLPAPRSHGKLRRRLTGTGAGSNFRFVPDLRLKPAAAMWPRVARSSRALHCLQRTPSRRQISARQFDVEIYLNKSYYRSALQHPIQQGHGRWGWGMSGPVRIQEQLDLGNQNRTEVTRVRSLSVRSRSGAPAPWPARGVPALPLAFAAMRNAPARPPASADFGKSYYLR